jgi:hypothetical protein
LRLAYHLSHDLPHDGRFLLHCLSMAAVVKVFPMTAYSLPSGPYPGLFGGYPGLMCAVAPLSVGRMLCKRQPVAGG